MWREYTFPSGCITLSDELVRLGQSSNVGERMDRRRSVVKLLEEVLGWTRSHDVDR